MARKPKEPVTTPFKRSTLKTTNDRQRLAAIMHMIWPRLIELWIAVVLVIFFLVRVLELRTAQRLLNGFGRRHIA